MRQVYYYQNKSRFLLPRWYGEEGEVEQFSLNVANQRGGEQGDILYARLMWILYNIDSDIISGPKISFDKISRGFTAIDKKFPEDASSKIVWAQISFLTSTPKTEVDRKKIVHRLIGELEVIAPSPDASWRNYLDAARRWSLKQ